MGNLIGDFLMSKKAQGTIREVGEALFHLAFKEVNKDHETMSEILFTLDINHDFDQYPIYKELYYLRLFCVDFGVSLHYGSDSPIKNEILDIFYEIVHNAVSDDENGRVFKNEANIRLVRYAEAVKNPINASPGKNEQNIFYTLGKYFNEFCNIPLDIRFMTAISLMFKSQIQMIMNTLNQIEINEISATENTEHKKANKRFLKPIVFIIGVSIIIGTIINHINYSQHLYGRFATLLLQQHFYNTLLIVIATIAIMFMIFYLDNKKAK